MGSIRMGSDASNTVVRVADLGAVRRYAVGDEVKIHETRAGSPLGTAGRVDTLHRGAPQRRRRTVLG